MQRHIHRMPAYLAYKADSDSDNIIFISDICVTREVHLLIRFGLADASSLEVQGCACNACLSPAVAG